MPDSAEATQAQAAAAPQKQVRQGRLTKLYTWPWFHRSIPAAVLVPVMASRGRVRWHRNPAARQAAIGFRSVILHGTGREGDVEEVARKSLVERSAQVELSWQKGSNNRARVEGFEHFEAAHAAGKGVIVSSVHLGPAGGISRTITRKGHRILVPAGDWFMNENQGNDHTGRTVKVMRNALGDYGIDLVARGGSYPVLAERLREGGIIYLPFDVPGSMPVTFLDKETRVASGPTALARETGAMILPAFAHRRGSRIHVKMHPPLDPADFPDAATMHQRYADIASAEVLERPETMATVFVRYLWPEVWPKYFSE